MSRAMRCLAIVALRDDLFPLIHAVGELGCMDIEQAFQLPGIETARLVVDSGLVSKQEDLNRQLFRVNNLIEILGVSQSQKALQVSIDSGALPALLAEIQALSGVVQALVSQRENLQAEQDLLPRFLVTVRKLMPLFPDTGRDPDAVSFGLLIARQHAEILDVLAEHVAEATHGAAQVVTGNIDAATCAMLIMVPGDYADAIGLLLDDHDVSRLRLPPEFETYSAEDAIAALEKRLQAIPAETQAIEAEIQTMGSQWSARLFACSCALHNELEVYRIFAQMGQTEMTVVLAGWVPEADVTRFEAALAERIGDHVVIADVPLTTELQARVPIVLTNPPITRSFESLVNLFSTPRYNGFDPTVLMAIFMPVFFGMMLGDIGYGVLLLALVGWLRRRLSPGTARDIMTILGLGAIWAVVFGVLYGELFGTLGEQFGLHAVWFDRADPAHLLDLLGLTVAVGAVHLTLGLILGIWEGLRARSRHDLFDRGGRLLGLVALFLLAGTLAEFLPSALMTPAVAALIVGVVLMAASVGRIGILLAPIEMIGLVGNVLSYLRIAAIGLSSVYLALVAGEIAGVIGSMIVGGLIAVLLHALNLALGAFSPTIQSLRLHYVEFFRNFYEGGGRLYEPFRLPAQPQE